VRQDCVHFLRAIDTAETDTFGASVVQDFDGVAVEDRDEAGQCMIWRCLRAKISSNKGI
jgi:hypothetical protein